MQLVENPEVVLKNESFGQVKQLGKIQNNPIDANNFKKSTYA